MGPSGAVHTTFISPNGDDYNTPIHTSESLSNMDVTWNVVEGYPTLFATNKMVKCDGWEMHGDLTGMSKTVDGVRHTIPFEYYAPGNALVVRMIVAKNSDTALAVSRNINALAAKGHRWQWWEEDFALSPEGITDAKSLSAMQSSAEEAAVPLTTVTLKVATQDMGVTNGLHVYHRTEEDPPEYKFDIHVDDGITSPLQIEGAENNVAVIECVEDTPSGAL